MAGKITVKPLPDRREPYTARGISRIPCLRCGAPSCYQWQCCADGNRWRGICAQCDIAINDLVLRFFRHPQRIELMRAYRRKVRDAA